jgi:hypothetical protein
VPFRSIDKINLKDSKDVRDSRVKIAEEFDFKNVLVVL